VLLLCLSVQRRQHSTVSAWRFSTISRCEDGGSYHLLTERDMKSFSVLQPGCFLNGVNSANDNSQSDAASFHHHQKPRTHRLWYNALQHWMAQLLKCQCQLGCALLTDRQLCLCLYLTWDWKISSHKSLKFRSRLCGRPRGSRCGDRRRPCGDQKNSDRQYRPQCRDDVERAACIFAREILIPKSIP
jgi:hypothetical protein